MTEPLVLELLALPKAVPEARRAVREHLRTPCPEVQLCVSELLANVIRHVGEGTPVTLRLTRTPSGRTRLEVTDPDPHTWLVLRRPETDDETGRGLLLLDAVAQRWGVRQNPRGKTIWCELPDSTAAVEPIERDPETFEVPLTARSLQSDAGAATVDGAAHRGNAAEPLQHHRPGGRS